ncbi:oligosaccharide flippase family protein [Candidatus Marinimicrobia bacterium]|nr:oligosaccharide flippase family protein [Candidatus Neomarinimicrobiota bacterium]
MLNKKIKMSDKKIGILILGTFTAQLITIAVTPILSRIYTPEDFGVFAIIFSISGILSTFIGGRYEVAIVQPRKISKSLNLALISSIGMILSTIFLIIIYLFFEENILKLTKFENSFLLYSPLIALFIGLFNILNMLNTKLENYKSIAIAKILKSITQNFLPIILACFSVNSINLLIGYFGGFFATYFTLMKKEFLQRLFSNHVSVKNLFSVLKEYKNFPLLSAPASLVNTISQQLPFIFIYYIGGEAINGFYFLASRIISIPVTLIGVSFGQVFYKEVTSRLNDKTPLMPLLIDSIKKLLIIAIPFFLLIFLLSPYFFPILFGQDWVDSGKIAQYLGFIFVIKFVVSTTSHVLSIKEYLFRGSIWKYLYFSTSIILYYFAYLYQIEFYNFLALLVIHEYLLYSIYFYLILISVKENDKKLIV